MFTKFAAIIAFSASAATAATTFAGTIIPPVRYQYGQYNEVYYGGTNPTLTSNPYVYVPVDLQSGYTAQRLNTPTIPGISPYQPNGPGTLYFSPYSPDGTYRSTHTPYLYSDYLPNQEVGQYGYTINDVRNEAYQNVPRIQTGIQRAPQPIATPAPETTPTPVTATDPKSKAIPLIDWAKAEHTRNPALYEALLTEAAKYDPSAVTAARKELDAKK